MEKIDKLLVRYRQSIDSNKDGRIELRELIEEVVRICQSVENMAMDAITIVRLLARGEKKEGGE